MAIQVRLEPWREPDLSILQRSNTPQMTAHLGGPESAEKLLDRHRRYVEGQDMFRVVLLPGGESVGSTGFWVKDWQGQPVYETGWAVLPEFQGRGIAAAAVRAVVSRAATVGDRRWLHAFPSVDNAPSNAVCRKVGFELLGDYDFEYPPGTSCAATTGGSTCPRSRTSRRPGVRSQGWRRGRRRGPRKQFRPTGTVAGRRKEAP